MPNLYDTRLPAQDVYVGDVKIAGKDAALFQKGVEITSTAAQLNTAGAAVQYGVTKYAKVAITRAADTNAHDTTLVLPKDSIVKNVWLSVVTAEATGTTKTIKVGIKGGDADAFLNGVSVATTGTKKGTQLGTGRTIGKAMYVDEGTSAFVPEPYVCTAATTVNYTLASNNFAELVANLIVEYVVFI